MTRRAALLPAVAALSLAVSSVLVASPAATAADGLEAHWTTDPVVEGAVTGLAVSLDGTLTTGASPTVVVGLEGVRVTGIPDACVASSTVTRRSSISADGTTLVCQLPATAAGATTGFVVPGVVTAAAAGRVGGTVTLGPASSAVEPRTVAGAGSGSQPEAPRLLRLVSSPDFLNADVGDLRDGPNHWTPRRSSNAINDSYRTSLANVMADWQSLAPDAVLVAGDLVEGHWDKDTRRTGTFGPLRTPSQRREAVRRAAQTFYPQWLQRFTGHGLDVYPAIGDHEVGDNPWDPRARALVSTYKQQFARTFTQGRRGGHRFADRPRHSGASGTAYAFRPVPQVQVVSIDVFDITPGRARLEPDRAQLRWLRHVLARAQADGVRWTIVQGHLPIVGPVRARGSSQLRVPGGERSALWRTFERYGVDLYLAGEVHDVTMTEAGGVTQLTHGGLFQFGLTNYALIDVYDDHLSLDLRDYDVRVQRHGRRLWETRSPGLPRQVDVDPVPFTIGTATVSATAGLQDRTGYLLPYAPASHP